MIHRSDLFTPPPPLTTLLPPLILSLSHHFAVTVVGGEDLPAFSTHALKTQYEKTIEEATPSKQVKVRKPPPFKNFLKAALLKNILLKTALLKKLPFLKMPLVEPLFKERVP